MELRNYQKETIKSIRYYFTKKNILNQLVVLPTGSGKTVVFSELIRRRALLPTNGSALVLAHRDELLIQAKKKILQIWPDADIGLIKAQTNDWQNKDIVLASVQTLKNKTRLEQLPLDYFSTVITDEAHHATASSYRKIYKHVLQPGVLHVGFTATPQRSDKTGLGRIFNKVVFYRSIAEMVNEGWLCPLINRYVNIAADFNLIKSTAGDFNIEDLALEVNTQDNNWAVVESWKKYASDRNKTVAFCVDVKHALDLRDAFKNQGIKAETIYGAMDPKERKRILKDFTDGKITVLSNVEVLTEGFDDPGVDCILSARPTKSASLYIQVVGRGTRTMDNKVNCLVLDVVGNAVNHKLITLPSIYGGAIRRVTRSASQAAQDSKPRKIRLPQAGRSRVLNNGYSQLQWLALTEEDYIISGKDIGTLRLYYNPEDCDWEFQEILKNSLNIIRKYSDKTSAFLGAESYAIENCLNPKNLLPDAYWRKSSVTKKQREILERFKLIEIQEITCGEASDIITADFTRKRLAKILGPKDKNYVDSDGIVHVAALGKTKKW